MPNITTVIQFIETGLADGGAETLVKDYALNLDRSCIRTILVTVNPIQKNSANYKRLSGENIQIIPIFETEKHFNSIVSMKLWNRLFYKRYVANKLLSIVRTYDVKVIHAHLEVLHYLRPISKQLNNVKIVHTCHNEPKRKYKKTRWENEFKDAKYLIKHNGLQIIALHSEMCAEINRMFCINNTLVVNNGIDFTKFHILNIDKAAYRRSVSVPEGAFVLGHVGRFSEAKNHSFLVDIFFEIAKKRSDAFLLMIGNGPYKNQIESKLIQLGLNGRYLILSHRTDISELLHIMDVFVFPSKYEGLPVSVVEAQVSGVRSLISNRVTKDCFFGPSAIPLPIDAGVLPWVSAIEDSELRGELSNDILKFNLPYVMNQLKQIYIEYEN